MENEQRRAATRPRWCAGVLRCAASAVTAVVLAACASHTTGSSTTATSASTGPSSTATSQETPSTTTTPAPCTPQQPSVGTEVYRGSPAACTAHLHTGNIIVLDFTPVVSVHGSVARAQPATSSNLGVLQPASVPADADCGIHDTCSAFRAVAAGSVTLMWTTASGCQPAGPCVQAAAARMIVLVT